MEISGEKNKSKGIGTTRYTGIGKLIHRGEKTGSGSCPAGNRGKKRTQASPASSRLRFFFFSLASPTAPTAARAAPSSGATKAFARSSCRVAVT